MKRMTFTRRALLLTLFVICITSLPMQAADIELVHFTYGSHGEPWRNYLNFMAERFTEETGIRVSFIVTGGGNDYRDKLFTMLAVGTPPDVTDANPAIAAPFLAQDSYLDLRPFIERDGFPINDIPPAALQGVTTPDGTLWGLPVSIFPVFSFYNADLFSQSGLQNPAELGDNWTWDTMREAARRLTYDADGDGINDVYGTTRIHFRWEMQVHQAGGQLYDRLIYPTRSRFNSSQVLTALEFLHDIVAVQRLNSPNIRTHDFGIGNVGFSVVDGPAAISSTLLTVPFEWGVARQPKGPSSQAARVNPDGFQILAESANKEAAWQWVQYLTGSVESQTEMARLTGRLPSLRDAMLQYPEFAPVLPENWMAIVDTAFDPDGYAAYVLPQSGLVDPVINSHLNRVWQGTESPQVVLQQIHDLVDRLLQEE